MTHINKLMTISGTAATEQDIIIVMDNFLCNIVGYELTYKYSDTSSSRSYGFASEGEFSERERMTFFASIFGSGGVIGFNTHTWLAGEAEGGTGNTNATYSNTYIQTSNNTFKYWIMSNKDVVYVSIQQPVAGTARMLGGTGYLKTPYTFKEDPLPSFGLRQTSSPETFPAVSRVRAYAAHRSFTNYTGGVGGGYFMDPQTTSSGLSSDYIGTGDSIHRFVGQDAESFIDGKLIATPITVYRTAASSLFTNESIRGYLPSIWAIYGDATRQQGDYVTGSGINVFTGEVQEDDIFIVHNEYNQLDNTQIIGPIINFDTLDHSVPYNVGDGGRFQLWLSSYYYSMRHNNNYFDDNGFISIWRDQHFHPNDVSAVPSVRNDALQTTLGIQPRTVSVEPNFNSNSTVRFTSSDSSNLTASLDISTDLTIFAVASYSNGSNRAPIINIRGDVSAVDTLFSLEFNENSSNSATTIMIAGGGTDREEYGSLSANTAYVLTATVSGTDTTLYVNGDFAGSSSITDAKSTVAGGVSTLNYSIGVDKVSGGSNGTVFADADISEVLVYRQALTEEDKQIIVCMLGNRYNITVSGTC